MSIIVIFIIALGLSMDAFSLSLIYGTLRLDKKVHTILSIVVGLFHFFMPILGYKIGELIISTIKIPPNIIAGLIFIILGIEMILSLTKEENIKSLTNLISIIIFAFTVSVDSFSIGISFGVSKTNIILSSLIFSIVSGLLTYIGISLGNKLSLKFGNISVLIGSIILIILGITYLT